MQDKKNIFFFIILILTYKIIFLYFYFFEISRTLLNFYKISFKKSKEKSICYFFYLKKIKYFNFFYFIKKLIINRENKHQFCV